MIHLLSAINWTGVFIAFAGYFFLGPLWYLLLFKKQYYRSLGRENDPPRNPAPVYIAAPALCSLIVTITSALLMYALGIDSYGKAIAFALLAGAGYLFTNTVNTAINPNIPKPVLYGVISGTFHLTGMVLVSVILVATR